MAKNKEPKAARQGVNPQRAPRYDRGGRAPGTTERVVPVTVLLSSDLYDELKQITEKFISPKTLKPYGMSAVVRYCCTLGLKKLPDTTAKDLLYYIPNGPKGEVGRHNVDVHSVKSTFVIHKRHIEAINKHLATINNSLVGTTTYVRMFVRENISDVRLRDLYLTIPESHKALMELNGWKPRTLLDLYNKAK